MTLTFDRTPATWHYVIAGVLAVAVPMAVGYGLYRADTQACYDGPCVLPLLLVIVPPYATPALVLLFAINRRLRRPLPHGWLPATLAAAVTVQAGLSLFALVQSAPHMRRIFFYDILLVPQGLAVGLVIGAVFWVVLAALARKTAAPGAGAPQP